MEIQSRDYPALGEQERVSFFLQKVYIWMTGGLVLTGLVAYQTSNSETLLRAIFGTPYVFMGLLLLQLVLVIAMSALVARVSATVAGAMFVAYAALNGLTLSVIFLAYTHASIAQVFFISAGMFGAMSLFGYFTKSNLSSWGSFLFMGLIGIILASVVNWFLKSPALGYVVSILGVFIFLGLTAYDTQKLKNFALSMEASDSDKPAIYGALTLYLDFINLFLMLLRLFGRRR